MVKSEMQINNKHDIPAVLKPRVFIALEYEVKVQNLFQLGDGAEKGSDALSIEQCKARAGWWVELFGSICGQCVKDVKCS